VGRVGHWFNSLSGLLLLGSGQLAAATGCAIEFLHIYSFITTEESAMDEICPFTLGFVSGALVWSLATARLRWVLGVLSVMVSGAIATLISGEYQESWS
jgi:hypothetical protein